MRPVRLGHLFPLMKGIQAEFKEPLRLFFTGRYHTHDILVQPLGDELLLHVCHKAFLVFGLGELIYDIIRHRNTKITLYSFPFTKIMAISGRARIAIVALMGR